MNLWPWSKKDPTAVMAEVFSILPDERAQAAYAVIHLFGKTRILATRKAAMETKDQLTIEVTGLVLGGPFKAVVTFDGRDKQMPDTDVLK